ncbi:hypothetical protein GCM10023191_052010 [Actinoallomurus oryzae]|uniref:Uncharacterized protein n=1 Tax=Actinoallomurus oryzae TaxID=502180 RepID=A0ABP8QE67_9ACTN
MTAPRRAAGVAAGAFLLACLVLPLSAPPASACNVGYVYKPTMSLNKPHMGLRKPCSTRTSMAGVAMVVMLTAGALAAAGVLALRKGERTTRRPAPPPAPGPGRFGRPAAGPPPALAGYLRATGLLAAAPPYPGPYPAGGGHGAHP